MKILFFILSLVVFRPLQAQADTVFNDTESFTVAKAIRLGRESSNNQTLGTSVRVGGIGSGKTSAQSIVGGAGKTGCPTSNYKNASNQCKPCPSNGYCNGSDSWACKSGYFQSKSGNGSCTLCTKSTTVCAGGEKYTCVGLGTWSADSMWRTTDSSVADPNKCQQCPNKTYTECHGLSDVRCKGAGTPTRFYATSAHQTDKDAADKKCEACPTLGTCNGSKTFWCKGYDGTTDNNWKQGKTNAYKDGSVCRECPSSLYDCNGKTKKCHGTNNDATGGTNFASGNAHATNNSNTTCEACPTNGTCNGSQTFWCTGYDGQEHNGGKDFNWIRGKTNAWKDGSTCKICDNNNYECNGKERKCYGTKKAKASGEYPAGTSYGNDYAHSTNSSNTTCEACPTNANCNGGQKYWCKSGSYRNNSNSCVSCTSGMNYDTCPGETNGAADPVRYNFSCKNAYFKYDGSTATTCVAINTDSVVVCKSGYTRLVDPNDSNKVYCIQPLD